MTGYGQAKGAQTRLLTGILSVALVASMVPTPALAVEFEALQVEDAVVAEVADEQAATGEDAVVQAESVNDATLEEAADSRDAENAIESVCLGELESAKADGHAGDVKPRDEHNGSDNEDKPADEGATSNGGKVSYIKRDWDGEKVTETTVDVDDAQEPPDDGKLAGGTYVVDGQRVYKDRIEVTRNTALVLADGCELDANDGIYVSQSATLSVFGGTGEDAGKIVAKTKHGAGIGAYSGHKSGNINVHGGIIEVRGGEHCAGIGSNDGDGTEVGAFTMYGGDVTATGGSKGAGIGGGRKSEANVKVYGGKLTATGGSDGAGIGGGENGKGGNIEIFGGEVHGIGSTNASGIGGGENRDAGKVTISGGTVYAVHRDGAGIGGGEDADGGTIIIKGGEVHSDYKGKGNGAGIGGGNHSGAGGSITIGGGNVIVTNDHGAGIGGGRTDDIWNSVDNSGAGGTITIFGGTVHATSKNAHGIGAGGTDGGSTSNTPSAGYIGSAGKITIDESADVTAEGFIAGVGGDSGTITVKGGTLTAKGVKNHDGGLGIRLIDGGAHLNVEGGTLHAEGAKEQPAINAAHLSFTGGATDARSKKMAIKGFKDLTVSGKGTLLSATSDKDISIAKEKVKVTNGATLESWSGGKSGNDACYQFDGEAMVIAGANKDGARALQASERAGAYKNKSYKYIRVTPCDHRDSDCRAQDEAQHTRSCTCCGMEFVEEHRFGDDATCDDCGFEQSCPKVVAHKLLTDGTIGLEFQVAVPKGIDYSDATVEFQLAGKGGQKVEIPFSQAQKLEDGSYGFVCPVGCIEMADEVTVSIRQGDEVQEIDSYSVARYVSDFKAAHGAADKTGNNSLSLHDELVKALADYGHYSQVQLARDNKWELGTDHAEMAAATEYTDKETQDAESEIMAKYDQITCERGEGVGSVKVSLVQGSALTLRLSVKTDKQVGSVTVDGKALSEGSWTRKGERWVMDLPAVSAAEAQKAHTVVVSSSEGETLVTVGNLSPVTYAGSILDDNQNDGDQDMRNAATALYRYCKASQAVAKNPQWSQKGM